MTTTLDKAEQSPNKAARPKDANYKWIYDAAVQSIAALGVKFEFGIIHHPSRPKCGAKDLVSEIMAERIRFNQRPIPRTDLLDIIVMMLNRQAADEVKAVRERIAYSETAPNRWAEYMKLVFHSDDEIDRIILQHCIWIQKRRLFKLPVDATHRPLFLNIFGAASTGKTSLLNLSLLKPIPEALIKAESDVSSIMNDERKHHNLGEYYAIKFGEMAGMKKVEVEKFKQLIDEDKMTTRILGTNTNERYFNNASLWATSNKRICSLLPEAQPRKWYELEMPNRSKAEMDAYIIARDAICPNDLYRCINENETESEMMKKWDAVHLRIIERCGYIDSVMNWIADRFNNADALTGLEITVAEICDEINSGNRDEKYSRQGVANKLRDLGYNTKKTNVGLVVYFNPALTAQIVANVMKRRTSERKSDEYIINS